MNTEGKLAAAIVKAQGMIKHAVKDSTNPAFRSKYADLGAVWDAVREALQANDLAIIQSPTHSEDGRVHLITMLLHTSGESIQSESSIPVTKQDAHGYGSGLTYLRRYSLASMLGVVSDDDDGNAAVEKPAKPKTGFEESSKTVAKTELDMMTAGEQETMRVHAESVIDLFNAGLEVDAADYCAKNLKTAEAKMAVWSLLPSNVRSSIKRHTTVALSTQP